MLNKLYSTYSSITITLSPLKSDDKNVVVIKKNNIKHHLSFGLVFKNYYLSGGGMWWRCPAEKNVFVEK